MPAMLTILIFILLFGALQAVLLLAVLLVRKKLQAFHIFISGYLVVLLLQLFFKVLSKMWLMQTVRQWYILSYYLPFLYGPLVLFFVRHYLHKTPWRLAGLLHFIPFGIYMALLAFSPGRIYGPAFLFFITMPLPRMLLQLISLVCYHYLALRVLTNKKDVAAADNEKMQFAKTFTGISFGVTCMVVVVLYFLYTHFPYHQNIRWAFIALTVFVYWVSYKTLQHPSLFKVIYGNNNLAGLTYAIPALKVYHPAAKYSNSGLKHAEAERIIQALNSTGMQKFFFDAGLTIDTLAEKLNCQRHHLSQVLNDTLQKSFNAFVNEKRVQEAKRILASPACRQFKISSVAYDAGFNSLSSFNNIFKKAEGITPSQYRLQCQASKKPAEVRR
jgi:AraC-like DNA-binding protein